MATLTRSRPRRRNISGYTERNSLMNPSAPLSYDFIQERVTGGQGAPVVNSVCATLRRPSS